MRLSIRHETLYRYSTPLAYTIQQLRLTPRPEPHQQVLAWTIATQGERNAFTDAYGNLGHMLTLSEPHDTLRIVAEGVVDVIPLDQGRVPGETGLSPLVFTVPTRMTAAPPAIVELTQRHLAQRTPSALLGLAEAIRDAVAYRSGATEVTSTAAEALALGQGVCQDHAHLYIACCHAAGIPVRYVSGYIDPGETQHAESHAWVDVWSDTNGGGWISIDVTHACYASDVYCRLAIGRDYDSAAPVRGVRQGGGNETMTVDVQVHVQ